MNFSRAAILAEVVFKTSRSSGKGGQNVNKVSTKVELDLDVVNSAVLDPEQKQKILTRLANRINKEGVLQVIVQSERSQLRNKELAIEKMISLLQSCFVEKKKRLPTRTPRSVKEKRLKSKKKRSEIKSLRRGKEW